MKWKFYTGVLVIMSFFPVLRCQGQIFKTFDLRPDGYQKVLIWWNAEARADTLSFELQRSVDRIKWNAVATIRPGPAHEYSYKDSMRDGIVYYRVVQGGPPDRLHYSPVRWLQTCYTGGISIWPNPAKSIIYVKTPFNSGSLDIIDEGGRLVLKMVITDFVMDVPVDDLARGAYFLQVRYGRETVVERIVKE